MAAELSGVQFVYVVPAPVKAVWFSIPPPMPTWHILYRLTPEQVTTFVEDGIVVCPLFMWDQSCLIAFALPTALQIEQ